MGIDNTYINSDNRVDEGLRIRSTDSIMYFINKKSNVFPTFCHQREFSSSEQSKLKPNDAMFFQVELEKIRYPILR